MKSHMLMAIVAVLLSGLLSTGCLRTGTDSAEHLRTRPLERYRKPIDTETLQPGDRIEIQLHSTELQTIRATIDDRSCVTLPLIGSIKIGGLTPGKAEEVIKREYVERKFFKESAIQVGIQTSDRTCYVQGHVQRPGACLFSRPITINMAISMAGGPDQFADDREIWLTRGGKKQKLDSKKDGNIVIVEPGDIIEVPRGWM